MKRRFVKKCNSEDNYGDKDENYEKSENVMKKVQMIMEQMFGFNWDDLRNFDNFTSAMYRPTDASSLGVCRALFGFCMVLDTIEERGLGHVDIKWGDPDTCHFPLIHALKPLPLPWMTILYSIMWIGAFGIMLGFHFKLACGLFALPYWYLFLLDKSFWNNHSYLFGIVTLLFWGTGANRYFALDAKLNAKGEKTVPYWNYFILKFQFFLLYFFAGLKKFCWEWLEGYAMTNLSRHWVFEPFKLFLSTEQTDFLIVHWFGFIFDLTVGFFMLFDLTRIPAMVFCTAFHFMNSRLFSIGMFPYVCLATMPLFCSYDWPKKLCGYTSKVKSNEKERNCDSQDNKNEGSMERCKNSQQRRKYISKKEKFVVGILLFHIALQIFLPYSHFLTKGYNNWVPGLYGYSWDMMVHAWDTALVVVKVRDNESKTEYFLDPDIWTPNDRWAKHGDMVRQYAFCIKDNLNKLKTVSKGMTMKNPWSNLSSNISVYVDIWSSLNGRFQQRLFDPTVDLLQVDWHPFKPISYVIPLLRQFSSYRSELDRIHREVLTWSNYTDALFVADYPHMHLENFIVNDLENVTLNVLEGKVVYRQDEEAGWRNSGITIRKGNSVKIETGRFHRVETAPPHPACYMYIFANRTKHHLAEQGIKEPVRVKEAFPVLKEIGYKVDSVRRSFGHILNAILHLTLGIPIIRRIPLDELS